MANRLHHFDCIFSHSYCISYRHVFKNIQGHFLLENLFIDAFFTMCSSVQDRWRNLTAIIQTGPGYSLLPDWTVATYILDGQFGILLKSIVSTWTT